MTMRELWRFTWFAVRAILGYGGLTPGVFAILVLHTAPAGAQQAADSLPASTSQATSLQPAAREQSSNFHAQSTLIFQGDPSFSARYSGPNSLSPHGQIQHTFTADLFAGERFLPGSEVHADLLVWQGFGLSQTFGIEAFPNGDAYKLGTESPNFTLAHLFLRRTLELGGPKEDIADSQLTLAGREDISRFAFTVGRFAMTDIFDTNAYAGDPHNQFMNWALIANLTWDYAADSVGYTTGASVDLKEPGWSLRYGFFQLPSVPNSFTQDDQLLMWPNRGADGPFFKSWSMASEWERRYSIGGHPGALRLLGWLNEADMAKYSDEAALLKKQGPDADLPSLRAYRYKYGFGLNWEQELFDHVGMFSRIGINDGREEPWAYTDANWMVSLGTSINGGAWHRPDDTFGLAGVVSGASSENQAFLRAGGTGILDGDGALNYGWETIVESYYSALLFRSVHGTVDYQFVSNPAFNRDRGPVSIFGLRLHWEM